MPRILCIILLLSLTRVANAQTGIGNTEALLIREAKTISDKLGDRIWPGIGKAPFTLVLVTDTIEYLIYHPNPSGDFQLVGKDAILQTDVYQRKRTFQKGLLATFPAVNGINCIVVGTLANTGRSLTNWMITLLHEHFHQFVNSQPGYWEGVNGLNLSGGDQTGMWMLNYPFSYDSLHVIKQYELFSNALYNTIKKARQPAFKLQYERFSKERRAFKKMLQPDHYKYFSFQVWQEGLATYTEYHFLQLLKSYRLSADVSKMAGFTPLKKYTPEFYQTQLNSLAQFELADEKRICFYAVGFAEGLLLDRVNPGWRKLYFKNKFSTDSYFVK
jgi:hypothetical protein